MVLDVMDYRGGDSYVGDESTIGRIRHPGYGPSSTLSLFFSSVDSIASFKEIDLITFGHERWLCSQLAIHQIVHLTQLAISVRLGV